MNHVDNDTSLPDEEVNDTVADETDSFRESECKGVGGERRDKRQKWEDTQQQGEDK